MKKFLVLFLCFCFFVNICAFGVTATDETANDISVNSCQGIDALSTILGNIKISENLRSAFLYEANSQTLMYTLEPDKPMYPASLVKIMTALVALELGNVDDSVIVSEAAISSVPHDAVSARLQVGEQLTLKDLLYCMLVGSANDAAAVIAEHIKNDPELFVNEMNLYAQKLGCTGTNFTNVHGLHEETQVTTARDTARILAAAMKNPTFREIFTAKDYAVPATNLSDIRKLATGNSLMDTTSKLYFDARVIGGRTGVANDGRRCLAAVAESNGMLLVSVVMGCESVYQEDGYSAISVGGYQETSALLDAGLNGYKTAQILYANQALQQWKVENGECDVVLAPELSVISVLPESATAENLIYRYTNKNLTAPIQKGEKLSSVQIWNGSMCVGEADLFALNSVDVIGSNMEELRREEASLSWLWVILGIVLVSCVLFMLAQTIKFLPRIIAKKRSANYRRSRRRSR